MLAERPGIHYALLTDTNTDNEAVFVGLGHPRQGNVRGECPADGL